MGELVSTVLVIIFIGWLLGSCDARNEMTVNPLLCKDRDTSGACKKFVALGRWRFRAEGQAVVLLRDDGAIRHLTDCTVFDAKNWDCDGYRARDGDVDSVPFDAIKYTSWWEWARMRALGPSP